MSEQRGLAGTWEDINNNLIVDVETYEDNYSGSDLPLVTKFYVTNGAPKSESMPEIFFEEVVLTVGVPPDLHVEKHTNLASGESFTYEYRSHHNDIGKIVFSVDGVVSPSRLLRVKRPAMKITGSGSNLSITSYLEALKDIDIQRWLKNILETMPIQEGTTKAEIEAQQDRLSNAIKEIGDTQEQLNNMYGFVTKKAESDRAKVNQHRKLIEDYLTHTSQACSKLIQMLDTQNAKFINTTRSQIVDNLSYEADKINLVSKSLWR